MAGSLLMLAALIVYGLQVGTFDLVDGPTSASRWLFLGFMFAFVIKAPLFPFHGWLPDTYREAPPEVTAVLSGVIAKAGVYGMFRIAIAKFPEPTAYYRTLCSCSPHSRSSTALSLRSVRQASAASIAYSSLAQSGLIAIGLFSGTHLGYDGAVLQMVAHGLVSTTLFLIAGTVERRTTYRRVRAPRGDGEGPPGACDAAADRRRHLARGSRISCVCRGIPDPCRGLPARVVVGGRSAQERSCSRRCTCSALISAVLHEARGSTVGDEAMDLRPGELALVVPLVGAPAGTLGLAGSDLAPRVRVDQPAHLAGAVQVINTPHVDWFSISTILVLLGDLVYRAAREPCSCPRRRAPDGSRPDLGRSASSAASLPRCGSTSTARRPRDDDLGCLLPRPLDRALAGHPLRHRPRHLARRLGAHGARAATSTSRSSSRSCSPRLPEWLLRRLREPHGDVPRARVVLDRALRHVRDRIRRRGLARGGTQVPGHRLVRLGRASLRLRARLRRDTGHLGFAGDRRHVSAR